MKDVAMLKDMKYCVVIPHRNLPDLLLKCLRSIPELSFVHVLIVDNSDTDKRADLVTDNFDYGFGGLTVIEREPLGIGYIRNEALRYLREQQFSGKLIFVDADDYLTSSAVDCFNQFKDADYDLVCFWMEGRDEAGNKTNNADYVNNNLKLYQETGDFSGVRFNSGPSCGKLINMRLILDHDIWFQELEACEDTFFSAVVGYYSEKVFVSDCALYVYVQRKGSAVHTITPKKAKMGFDAAYDTTCWLKERSEIGYGWTQFNVVWHWINWCQLDWNAWKCFPKVFGLCDKRSALKGVIIVIKRRLKALIKYRKT